MRTIPRFPGIDLIFVGPSSRLRAADTFRRRARAAFILLLFYATSAALEAEDYIYATNDNATITIYGFTGADGAVTIPGTINGLPVSEIGGFFSTNVTSVTIGDRVSSIASGAFRGCTALKNVIIGSGLTNIQIANKWAVSPFQGCTGLTNFTVDTFNPAYSTLDGVLFNKNYDSLIIYPTGNGGSYTVPDSVTEVGYWAFSGCTGLTNVTIGSTVTSIRAGAFNGCTGLTSITIPDGVTSIFWLTFQGCTGLTSVTLPTSMTNIGYGTFGNCTGLTNLTIPDNVTEIGSFAFSSCTGLMSLTIPNNVTSIGNEAFEYCTGLISATIPRTVTVIGESPFGGCTSLTAITVDALNPVFSSVVGVLFDKNQRTLIEFPGGKAGSYRVPDSVTNIGSGAFSQCNLTSLTIGNNVASIGNGAFEGCTSLTNITLPTKLTRIGDGMFANCSGLSNVEIPNSVTNIEDSSFLGCTKLTAVYFKGNAPSVGLYVFDGDFHSTIYYLPGTRGWGSTFAGRPTALWSLSKLLILNNGPRFGAQTNGFGFIISWATNISVVVEACTNLASPAWSPVGTNNLTGGSSYFSDPRWTSYPGRFYRVVVH